MSRLIFLFTFSVFLLLVTILEKLCVPRIASFILFGVTVGLYYGWFNNDIFHKSGKFNNEFEKVHTLWIHIVCGLAGSISLFILLTKFPFSSSEFGLGDFALLLFGILGIVGLLPRTFWFLANSGNLFERLFK